MGQLGSLLCAWVFPLYVLGCGCQVLVGSTSPAQRAGKQHMLCQVAVGLPQAVELLNSKPFGIAILISEGCMFCCLILQTAMCYMVLSW